MQFRENALMLHFLLQNILGVPPLRARVASRVTGFRGAPVGMTGIWDSGGRQRLGGAAVEGPPGMTGLGHPRLRWSIRPRCYAIFG